MLRILVIAALFVSQGCSLPEVKEAKFQKDTNEVIEELKSLSDFEDAGIRWSASSFDDKTTNILIVQLLNGKGLSDNEEELRDLGREAMRIVNGSIENETDYDKFQVVFVRQDSAGPATKSVTKPFEYSLDELK